MIEAELPDGTILEFPEGTDPAVIQNAVKQYLSQAQPVIDPNVMAKAQAIGGQPAPRGSVADRYLEPAATLASGAVAEPLAGLYGMASIPFVGAENAGTQVEQARQALTYQPRTQAGQQGLQAVAETVAPIVEPIDTAINAMADYAYDLTGSPAIAAAVKTTPAALAEIVALKGLSSIRSGTRLIDDMGRPTEALRKSLNKHGLTYENLTPEAVKLIPDRADPKLIPSPKSEQGLVAEKALLQQIKSGGTDDALAGLRVVGNSIKPDKFGLEAMRQGFDPGFVQAVKTTNKSTKADMRTMLNIMERIQKNRAVGLDIRPTDVVGRAVKGRLDFIKSEASKARIELDNIARNNLRGKSIDGQPILDQLSKSLDNLDISVTTNGKGVPIPEFAGSMISKDKTSQRVIKDLIDLMAEGGEPDALRFHKLKRQLDNLIDFRKKSAGGLTDAGKNVLKDIRHSLNQSLRATNANYARVNDTLSKSLTALDDFQKVSGSSIDIFGDQASKAIGTDLRGLMSNRKTRVKLDNAVNLLDDTAKELGGDFTTDVKRLSLFANGIEDKFGAVAQTSFKGEIESAINQAGSQGVKESLYQQAVSKGAKGVEALRGINDYNAYKAMYDLLDK